MKTYAIILFSLSALVAVGTGPVDADETRDAVLAAYDEVSSSAKPAETGSVIDGQGAEPTEIPQACQICYKDGKAALCCSL